MSKTRFHFRSRSPLCASVVKYSFLIFAICAGSHLSAETPKGYTGIYTRSNSNVLQAENAFAGITVTNVIENSPGAAAGVKVNDVILSANGSELGDPNQLIGLTESLPVGSVIELRVERDTEVLTLPLTTVARVLGPDEKESAPKTHIENKLLGFEFQTPSDDEIAKLRLAPKSGIKVLRLAEKGPIDDAGIKSGEIITEANEEAVASPEGFLEVLNADPEAGSIKLRVANDEGKLRTERVKIHRPRKETRKFAIPLLVHYSGEPSKSLFKIPILLFKRERIESATKYQWLFFFKYETGRSEELLEVE